MLNALEKVMYPNGTTRALGDIVSGSVSSIIDEVHANTSAITSITAQLSTLVDEVGTNTNAISALNTKLLEQTAGIDHLDRTRNMVPWYEGVDLTTVFADEISEYSDEWAWLKNRVLTGNFFGIHIGDYIPFETTESTPQSFNAIVAGINTYKGTSGADITTPNHIDFVISGTFGASSIWFNKVNYNNGIATEKSPYKASDIYHYLNSLAGNVPNEASADPALVAVDYTNTGVYSALPTKIKNALIDKIGIVPLRYSEGQLLTEDNDYGTRNLGKIWLLSDIEVFGFSGWDKQGEESGFVQYPLFAGTVSRRLRNFSWWLMNPISGRSTDFSTVNDIMGYEGRKQAASNGARIVFGFRVGTMATNTRKKATSKKKGE